MSLIRDKKWCYEKTKNNFPLQRYKSCPAKTINHQDSTLFAVGSEQTDNKLWYSNNGINWSNQDITGVQETMNKINDIAYYFNDINNYIYVAVGDPSTNNIIYSYNKKDWLSTDISYQNLSSEIFSITYAVNKFVAVSESKLLYSYDGLKWFDSSDNDLSLNKVYYGDKFIAINTNPLNDISSELLYSSDGINWTQNNLDTFHFEKINNIKFYNDKWYIVGNVHNVMWLDSFEGKYSYTGRQWNSLDLVENYSGYNGIVFGKDNENNSLIITYTGNYSKNGVKWYYNDIFNNIYISNNNVKTIYYFDNLYNKNLWYFIDTGESPYKVYYSNNGFDISSINIINDNSYSIYNLERGKDSNQDVIIAVCYDGNEYYDSNNFLLKSYDGIQFEKYYISLIDLSDEIITKPNRWVVVGSDQANFNNTANKTISYSDDLINWYDSTYNFKYWGISVEIGKDDNGNYMFVAVGKDNTPLRNIVWSYDGIDWTPSTGDSFNIYARDITYGNFDGSNIWLATGYDTNNNNLILKSDDGKNWTNILNNNGLNIIQGQGIIIGKDLSNNKDIVVVCGFNGGDSTTPYYSTNLQDFNPVTTGSSSYSQYEIQYYNGLFVIVGATNTTINSDILWSTDGINFNQATDVSNINTFDTTGYIYNIKHGFDSSGDEIWVAVGYVVEGSTKYQKLWWSKDGKKWYNNNAFNISFTTSNSQVQYGVNNGYDLSGNRIWVYYGYGKYYISTDGKNWTDKSSETINRNVMYGTELVQNFNIENSLHNSKSSNIKYNLKFGKDNNDDDIWLTYNYRNSNNYKLKYTNLYYYSYDTINWKLGRYFTDFSLNEDFIVNDMDFGYVNSNNPLFVLFCYNETTYEPTKNIVSLYSYNGINWEYDSCFNSIYLNNPNNFGNYIWTESVKYGKDENYNNLWVCSTNITTTDNSNSHWYSYNGINWEPVIDIFGGSVWGLAFGELDRPVIIESVDGISGWTEIVTTNFFDDECKNIVFKKTEVKESFNDPCKPDIINEEKQWIAIGNYDISTNTILKSDDVITWTDVSNDFLYNTIDLISMNNFNYFNYIIIGRDNSNNSTVKYSQDGNNWFDVTQTLPFDVEKLIETSWKYTETIPEKIICQPKVIFTTPPAGSIATARSRFSHVATNSIRGNARYSGRYTKAEESNTIYGVSTRPFNKF